VISAIHHGGVADWNKAREEKIRVFGVRVTRQTQSYLKITNSAFYFNLPLMKKFKYFPPKTANAR
jgi:hypothetical protein